jgi:hypothetical protein
MHQQLSPEAAAASNGSDPKVKIMFPSYWGSNCCSSTQQQSSSSSISGSSNGSNKSSKRQHTTAAAVLAVAQAAIAASIMAACLLSVCMYIAFVLHCACIKDVLAGVFLQNLAPSKSLAVCALCCTSIVRCSFAQVTIMHYCCYSYIRICSTSTILGRVRCFVHITAVPVQDHSLFCFTMTALSLLSARSRL